MATLSETSYITVYCIEEELNLVRAMLEKDNYHIENIQKQEGGYAGFFFNEAKYEVNSVRVGITEKVIKFKKPPEKKKGEKK